MVPFTARSLNDWYTNAQNKMADILWMTTLNAFFNEMFLIWLKFHCILLSPQGTVGNKSSLVEVLAWCERQPQSLSELIITFTEESNNPNFSLHFFATLYANKVDVWYIRRINKHLKSSVDGNEVRGIVIEKKYMVKDIQMKRIVFWSQECKDISHILQCPISFHTRLLCNCFMLFYAHNLNQFKINNFWTTCVIGIRGEHNWIDGWLIHCYIPGW